MRAAAKPHPTSYAKAYAQKKGPLPTSFTKEGLQGLANKGGPLAVI